MALLTSVAYISACLCLSVCKADWYNDKVELENSERADSEDIELSVSNYSCSPAVDNRGFDTAFHHYILVISARLNAVATRLAQYKVMLHDAGRSCDVKCQLKTVVNTVINQSRPVIDR